jgi:ABC transporter, permease protein
MMRSQRMPRHSTYERRKARVGFVFIIPWIIGTVFFFFRPLVESMMYSLGAYEITDTGYTIRLTGFSHYIEIFTEDANYVRNLTDALKNMALQVPVILIFSLFMAILLNQKFVGRTAARAVFFLPIIIGNGVILSIINGDVFAQSMSASSEVSHMFQSTFLGTLLLESGMNQELVTMATGLVDSVFQLIWKSGIQILIFIAALQTVSDSMYEVAKIEGATGWETFWKVTFPIISPMIVVNMIYTVIDSFVDLDNPVMAQIDSLSQQMLIELSSAMAWFYFLVVLLLIGLIYLLVNRRVFYQV